LAHWPNPAWAPPDRVCGALQSRAPVEKRTEISHLGPRGAEPFSYDGFSRTKGAGLRGWIWLPQAMLRERKKRSQTPQSHPSKHPKTPRSDPSLASPAATRPRLTPGLGGCLGDACSVGDVSLRLRRLRPRHVVGTELVLLRMSATPIACQILPSCPFLIEPLLRHCHMSQKATREE
jgi:hypothetical protein